MARINLIGWRNQAGLSRDLALLQDVLTQAGHEVHVNGLTPPRRPERLWLRLRAGGPPWDLAIFVEKVVPAWMELARHNVLIPNPEWFDETRSLGGVDAIWAKSRVATEALGDLGLPVRQIGFSTGHRARIDPAVLEQVIARVIGLPPSWLQEIGRAARIWFEANDRGFRQRLVAAVEATQRPDEPASH